MRNSYKLLNSSMNNKCNSSGIQMHRIKDLEQWLNSPVTKDLLELIQEHRDACRDAITGVFLNQKISTIDLNEISQLKGQLLAMDIMIGIQDFLKEKTEVKSEN